MKILNFRLILAILLPLIVFVQSCEEKPLSPEEEWHRKYLASKGKVYEIYDISIIDSNKFSFKFVDSLTREPIIGLESWHITISDSVNGSMSHQNVFFHLQDNKDGSYLVETHIGLTVGVFDVYWNFNLSKGYYRSNYAYRELTINVKSWTSSTLYIEVFDHDTIIRGLKLENFEIIDYNNKFDLISVVQNEEGTYYLTVKNGSLTNGIVKVSLDGYKEESEYLKDYSFMVWNSGMQENFEWNFIFGVKMPNGWYDFGKRDRLPVFDTIRGHGFYGIALHAESIKEKGIYGHIYQRAFWFINNKDYQLSFDYRSNSNLKVFITDMETGEIFNQTFPPNIGNAKNVTTKVFNTGNISRMEVNVACVDLDQFFQIDRLHFIKDL